MKNRFIYVLLVVCIGSLNAQSPQTETVQQHLETSRGFYSKGQLDSAYTYAKKGYKLAKVLKADSLQLEIVSTLSYLEPTIEKAILYLNETKPLAIKNSAWFPIENLYRMKGIVYFNNTQDEKALIQFLKVDSILQQKGNNIFLTAMNKVSLVDVLFKITITVAKDTSYLQQLDKNIDEGLLLIEKASKIPKDSILHYNAKRLHVPAAILYEKKGFISEQRKQLQQAIYHYKKALAHARPEKNYLRESSVYNSLANIYQVREEQDSALYYYKKELETIKKTKDTLEHAISHYRIAAFYNKTGQPEKALKYLKISQTLMEDAYFVREELKFDQQEILANIHYSIGNFEKAYEASEKAKKHLLKIQESTNEKNIAELETKYRTEKKEQEIAILTSKNKLSEERRKNERILLLGGLVLLLSAGLFLYFQYSNRQKTNKKLKELDTAKSTFFANISHEFRTPLSLIKGPIEDLLDLKALPKTQRSNLLAAQRNTGRLESLIEQLLALSKLESGEINLQVQPGELSSFIAAQIDVFNYVFSEKKLETHINLSEKQTTDWFDHDFIEKIISNLLGNAIKYTPEKGTITIFEKREKNTYKLSVKNSGVFLSTEQKKNIFQRFYQTDPKNPGTGIGLALTKELVELHKGTIKVKSKENDFTEFIISIPITKDSYTATEILVDELQKQTAETVAIHETNIEAAITATEDAPILLVVDDSKEIRDYVASVFEKDYLIFKAADGKEGFEKAKSEIPDIIISDVLMPVEDGFSLTKNVKEDPLTSHIPVILLTAKNKVVDKLEGMVIGADAYITKPFSSKLVKATAANLIETRRKLQQRFAQEVILTPKEIAVSSADEQFLERLQKVMDKHLTNSELTVDLFGTEMGVSRMQLHRKLKALTGYSTTEFLRNQRLKLAAQLLKGDKISVAEVGYTVGFNDASYFGKCFKKEFGVAPSDYASE
ncbi:response regulator [Aequorivita marina]|uniref:response regulator n=1 Tax=Aequorivita marina TaxID=3073654 RepID=UPI002876F3B6|nr:response regulator [Aequorivita sp. S2608]MDS1298483.1 response regulator [Aequorivita sp. S2608]